MASHRNVASMMRIRTPSIYIYIYIYIYSIGQVKASKGRLSFANVVFYCDTTLIEPVRLALNELVQYKIAYHRTHLHSAQCCM